MVVGLGVLLAFQLLGEIISFGLGRHVPGPVIGMALFVCAALVIARHRRLQPALQQTAVVAQGLLGNLGMLFIPAGVGIMQEFGLIESRGLALVIILVVSTALTLVATVWTFLLVKRLLGAGANPT